MGIVARQSVWNSVILYTGVAIGFFNSIFLYPQILSKAEWGVIGTILSGAVILVHIAGFGGATGLIKFLPHYRVGKNNNGLLRFILLTALSGVTLVILTLVLSKDLVLIPFSNEPLLDSYYYHLPVLVAGFVLFEIISGYLNAIYKTSLQLFFREIVFRLGQTTLLVLKWTDLIDFNTFIACFVCLYAINFLILATLLILAKNFDLRPARERISWESKKWILKYGGFTLLSGLASSLSNRMDILMVGAMAGGAAIGADSGNEGLQATASYMLAVNIGLVLDMPLRAIGHIAHPVISNSWKEKDLNNIGKLYKESSLNLMIIGGLMFIGIWINFDSFLSLLPPEYHDVKWVFFFIGISKFANLTAGINSHILVTSKYFRFSTYFILSLAVLIFISNTIFIPIYGLIGAALATAISLFLYNVGSIWFIYKKFNILPFSGKTIYVMVLSFLAYAVGEYIPNMSNVWIDIAVRSIVVVILYFAAIRIFKLSDEINKLIDKVFGLIR